MLWVKSVFCSINCFDFEKARNLRIHDIFNGIFFTYIFQNSALFELEILIVVAADTDVQAC